MKTMDMNVLLEERTIWTETVKQRKKSYKESITLLKQKEKELKAAKHEKYLKYKMLKTAEHNLKYFDSVIKTLPSRLRRWGRDNPGRVWNNIEEGKYGIK